LLALIPLAVGINLALGQLAARASLPLFLDTVGTVLVAALAGLWPALLTGVVSQVVFTIVSGNGT
jgi:energy-coupling factor transport system substrate-specific component